MADQGGGMEQPVEQPGGQPDQQQPPQPPQPPHPDPLTMYNAILVLEGRIAAMTAERTAERRQNDEQRAQAEKLKAMNRMPKYNGDGTFRTFKLEFETWFEINKVNDVEDDDFKKLTLLSAFTSKAADMIRSLRPGQPAFTGFNYAQYYARMCEIFQPDAESAMSRVEFAQRKQGQKENIAVYAEQKISLFLLAYPDGNANFPTLLTEFVKGCYANVVKRRIRIRNPTNIMELKNVAVEVVAIERESYMDGYGEATSLDGLSAVTTYGGTLNEQQAEPMDIDKIGAIKSQRREKQPMIKCWHCNKLGHRRSECRKRLRELALEKEKEKSGGHKGKQNFQKKEWKNKNTGLKKIDVENSGQNEAQSTSFLGDTPSLMEAQRLLDL